MTTASSYANLVQELYVAYFGRPADYYGLQNFEAALAAANAPTDPAALAMAYSTNSAVKSLIDSFGTSAESTALYGSGSTESFVNAIFENLFNRPAAVAGLSFWVNAIESGQVSKGDAALAILAGAESNTTTQGVSDWTLIQNKIAVATNFTTALGNSSTQIVDYAGAAAAQDARLMLAGVTASTDPTTFNVQTTINNIVAGNTTGTFNLTTGVDTLIGGPGNNVFNAILDNAAGVSAGGQAATLQSFDSITGGTLNNTLNITDFGLSGSMSIPSGASISGITTLNVNSLEALNLDVSGWSTLTTANFLSSTGTDTVTVGDNVALSVVDSSGNVTTYGGSTVSVKTDTSHTVNVHGGADTSSVTISGGAGGTVIDGSTKGNTITSVSVTGSHNTTTVEANALTNLTMAGESYGSIVVDAAAGTRTLNLTMNGDAFATVVDATATTVDVSAITAASTPVAMQFGSAASISFNDAVGIAFIDGGQLVAANDKVLNISGAGYFTGSTYGLNAAAAINATGSTGVDTIQLASANGGSLTQSFVGGSGQDIIWIGAGQTGTVTGGSANNNEIVLDNAGTATVTDIASVTHFSTFGVAGNTQGSFDMSKVSGYNSFDVQSSGGNVSFINAATGSSISLEGGNTHVITLQTVDTTGQSDSAGLTLGTTSSTGHTYAQVTLEDSINVGTGTVNLTSNVSSSGSTNTLTSLFDNNWVTLNTSGTGNLDIVGNKVDSANLTINNTLAASHSGSLTIGTLTDNLLSTLTLKGADGITITNLASTSTNVTLVDNDTAAVSVTNLVDTALTSATFTNSVNTTAGTFVVNSAGALTEAGLATLNLNGNVKISIAGDAVASGITVAGGTDNADVSFASVALTASGKVNSIALGNGNDTVTLGSSPTASIPGATEVDTVTWKAITGTAAATEQIDVTWQAFTTAVVGDEIIGGMDIHSDGTATFTAAQVATVADGGTVAGLTISTPASGWTVTAGVGSTDTYFTSTTANATVSTPSDANSSGSGATPTFSETTVGTAGTGGTESIGGATVSTTTNGAYTAAQVATVAGGGTVAGLTLSSSPTLWTIGAAAGTDTAFTSTTANHAEPGPVGAGSTGAATAPTSVQTTAGVTPVAAGGGGGVAGSTDTVTVGTGNDSISDFTAGTLNATLTESSTSTDSITANYAATLHVTAGNGANTISDTAAGASIAISAGTGVNNITLGTGTSGTIAVGTHTLADTISLGATNVASNSTTSFEKITGLNNAGTDVLVFSGETAAVASIQHITSSEVAATAGGTGDATLLSAWIAAATGAAGSGVTTAAHSISWFQFQGNTYLVEMTGADTGTLAVTDTVVELTGTGYTFAKTTFTGGNGHVNLLG